MLSTRTSRTGLRPHNLELRKTYIPLLWPCHDSRMLSEAVMIPEQKPMLLVKNCSNSHQHCFGLGSITRNADSPCMQRSRISKSPQCCWLKAYLGTPAFSESSLLICQFSSCTNPGTLMGPEMYPPHRAPPWLADNP